MATEQPTTIKPDKSMSIANQTFILAFLPFGIEFVEGYYGTFIVLVHLFGEFLAGPGPFGINFAFLPAGHYTPYPFLFEDWLLGGLLIFILNVILFTQLRSHAQGNDRDRLITILALIILIASVAIFFLRKMIPLPLMALADLARKSSIIKPRDK